MHVFSLVVIVCAFLQWTPRVEAAFDASLPSVSSPSLDRVSGGEHVLPSNAMDSGRHGDHLMLFHHQLPEPLQQRTVQTEERSTRSYLAQWHSVDAPTFAQTLAKLRSKVSKQKKYLIQEAQVMSGVDVASAWGGGRLALLSAMATLLQQKCRLLLTRLEASVSLSMEEHVLVLTLGWLSKELQCQLSSLLGHDQLESDTLYQQAVAMFVAADQVEEKSVGKSWRRHLQAVETLSGDLSSVHHHMSGAKPQSVTQTVNSIADPAVYAVALLSHGLPAETVLHFFKAQSQHPGPGLPADPSFLKAPHSPFSRRLSAQLKKEEFSVTFPSPETSRKSLPSASQRLVSTTGNPTLSNSIHPAKIAAEHTPAPLLHDIEVPDEIKCFPEDPENLRLALGYSNVPLQSFSFVKHAFNPVLTAMQEILKAKVFLPAQSRLYAIAMSALMQKFQAVSQGQAPQAMAPVQVPQKRTSMRGNGFLKRINQYIKGSSDAHSTPSIQLTGAAKFNHMTAGILAHHCLPVSCKAVAIPYFFHTLVKSLTDADAEIILGMVKRHQTEAPFLENPCPAMAAVH